MLRLRLECDWRRKFKCVSALRRYNSESWNILFFGTDLFAVKPLQVLNSCKLNSKLINNLEVVCPIEKRRPKDIRKHAGISTARKFAKANGLKIHDWPLNRESSSFLSRFHLGVVISFGHFIPSWVINNLSCGAINFHPSLLPKWRGPSPMIHTLLNGESETGVTVIEVSTKKFDAGAILLQQKVQIEVNRTHDELSAQLSDLSGEMLIKVLSNFAEYRDSSIAQDKENITTAPKVTKEHGYMKWSQFSCLYIQRLWCAIGQQVGLRCKWNDTKVKLGTLVETKISLSDQQTPGQPFFDASTNVLYIKCKDGWVGWQSLQMEYRQSVTAREFYNGYLTDKSTGKVTETIFHDL